MTELETEQLRVETERLRKENDAEIQCLRAETEQLRAKDAKIQRLRAETCEGLRVETEQLRAKKDAEIQRLRAERCEGLLMEPERLRAEIQRLRAENDAKIRVRCLREETERLRAEKEAEIQRLLAKKGELQRDLAGRHLDLTALQQSQAEEIRSLPQQVESLSLAQHGPVGGQTKAPIVPATSTQPQSSSTPFGAQRTDSTSTPQAQPLQAGNDGAGRGEKVVKGAITDDMIDWLADNVAAKDWKPLVRKLGLSNQECDDIDANTSFDIREKRLKAFQRWKMTKPQKAKVDVLLKAMEDKKLYQTARDFRAAQSRPGSAVSIQSIQSTVSSQYFA